MNTQVLNGMPRCTSAEAFSGRIEVEDILAVFSSLRKLASHLETNDGQHGHVIVSSNKLIKSRRYLIRENFAELHPPLVKGVETPDKALKSHALLVQCQQLSAGIAAVGSI